jgi:hypothetical protein
MIITKVTIFRLKSLKVKGAELLLILTEKLEIPEEPRFSQKQDFMPSTEQSTPIKKGS